jgi:hypothetical protein
MLPSVAIFPSTRRAIYHILHKKLGGRGARKLGSWEVRRFKLFSLIAFWLHSLLAMVLLEKS